MVRPTKQATPAMPPAATAMSCFCSTVMNERVERRRRQQADRVAEQQERGCRHGTGWSPSAAGACAGSGWSRRARCTARGRSGSGCRAGRSSGRCRDTRRTADGRRKSLMTRLPGWTATGVASAGERRRDAVGRAHGGAQAVGEAVDAAAPVASADRAEGHSCLVPGGIERLEVVGLGIGLGAQGRERRLVELGLRESPAAPTSPPHRASSRLRQALLESCDHVGRLAEQLDRRLAAGAARHIPGTAAGSRAARSASACSRSPRRA